MGTKKDPVMSNDTDSNITPENDVEGKLRLNKQTLQDLSPTPEHGDKVRGGVPATIGRCTLLESDCR